MNMTPKEKEEERILLLIQLIGNQIQRKKYNTNCGDTLVKTRRPTKNK